MKGREEDVGEICPKPHIIIIIIYLPRTHVVRPTLEITSVQKQRRLDDETKFLNLSQRLHVRS